MNKLRSGALALLVVGALFTSRVSTVLANTDGENSILSFLRVTVMAQFQTVLAVIGDSESNTNARFDAMDTKLERIYSSCNRTATPTRRVTTAQANTCVNNCFTNSAITGTALGAGVVDQGRFIACISRCPSNTLRNQECAQRYTRMTEAYTNVNGQPRPVSISPARYGEICAAQSETRYQGTCRVVGEAYGSGLTACLVDSQVYTCQQDCDTNFRNVEGYTFCMLRCNNRARSTELYNGLRESGFINEQGSLGFDTLSNTTIQSPPAVAPSAPAAPSTPTTLTPAPTVPETYAQCVYRCDSERTTCLGQTPQPTTCQSSYDTCYQGCSARLTGGAAR